MSRLHLRATALLDYEAQSIQQLVERRGWRALDVNQRIGAVYAFVRDEIGFGYNETDSLPASRVLADGYGQCNTKATLLMALLRAVSVPSRLVGGLYAPSADLPAPALLDPQTSKAFRAVFRRRVDRSDAAKSFRKAILQSAGLNAPALQDEIGRFVAWLPTFQSGSELRVEYLPNAGLTVRVASNKEVPAPFTASTGFATALFGTWVGPRAIDEGLRDSLLARP